MKAIKLIGIIFVLLLVIIAGGAYFLFSNLNTVVKQAVEIAGPEVTKTSVTLDAVALELTKGKGELKGFVIGNPQGFATGHLFKLDRIFLEVDPASLGDKVLVLKNITIEGVNVIAEQKGTTTNIQALLKTLTAGNTSSPAENTESQSGGSQQKFMIENLRFADGALKLVTEKYGEKSLDLPKLELKNIGSRSQGLTSEELGKAILEPLLKNAKKAAEKALQSEARDKVEAEAKQRLEDEIEKNESLKNAKERLKGVF